MNNTGIMTVTVGNTVGYIGDVELSNGLDLYSTAADNAAWVSLSYSHTGNDAANASTTGYAWLNVGTVANTISFNVQLPADDASTFFWSFRGADGALEFPDATLQTTAYNISGPFADDSEAAAGGVALNGLYYDASGNVKIRLT
jgi:hypothetical protein